MYKAVAVIGWTIVALLGAFAYSVTAFQRSEPLNAVWILTAALCTYSIGYRFYSKWIAAKVLTLNDRRATPCECHEDGRDFVKTNKWIVFGHHFAAISGPGPLVGPVLAAQFGYLPGTLWILIGVVLGGAVQDFIILFCSMRRNGKSLGEMVREEINTAAGFIALCAILSILVILVAVLGLIVVKALAESPWGTFTVGATIPIALFMGFYLRYWRPGRVLEVTVIGVLLLLLAVWGGKFFHEVPSLARVLTLEATGLGWAIILYGLAASILPVWLLLAPRDYLSTFMKLGTIAALAIGIFAVMPDLKLPALSRFVDGTGPVFAGKVFPFCFITIACGAISGFHSLIASGTTPKMITRESYARPIGYGSMLLESFVAIMALIAACTLDPGVYFAMNSPPAIVGKTPEAAAAVISGWGFPVSAEQMNATAANIGETSILGRTGGAPTLAVGMANIFSQLIGGQKLLALWYHFAIMFEALFILTTVDAGTRVGRFLLQAFLGQVWKPLGNLRSYRANVFASLLFVSAWGYFLYQGILDPLGGINSLWPIFGIANQLLAVVALCLATTVLIKMNKKRLVWITLVPVAWLVMITFTAGYQKIYHASPSIGFLAKANQLSQKLQSLEPAASQAVEKEAAGIRRQIFNQRLDAVVTGLFLVMVGGIVITSACRWCQLCGGLCPLDLKEEPPVWLSESVLAAEKIPMVGKLSAMLLIGFGLARQLSGEAKLERTQKAHVCRAQPAASKGALWAELEDQRFKNPRCC
jgi:carbon starvation protein